MPYIALVLFCAVALSAAPSSAAEPAEAGARLNYTQAMQEMLRPMCTVACADHDAACMEKCMAPDLMSTAPEDGGDEAACDRLGGVFRRQMPPCEQALNALLTLDGDSTVEAGLQVVAHIYRACSVQTLCGGTEPS